MKLLLLAGLVLRLIVLSASEGFGYDLQGFTAAERAFRELGLSAYSGTNNLWPYPPAYFPWLVFAADLGGFNRTLRAPAIIADLVLAWLVSDLLRRRGATRTAQLAAASVVLFAPVLIAHSSHHGQLDSVATAFGVAAVWVWTRPGQANRALVAGLLIGAGATVKTVPLLLILALSPSARDWSERIRLAAVAGGVWLVAVVPFFLAAPEGTESALTYKGVPGFGGLSLVLVKLLDGGLFTRDAFIFLTENSQVLLLGPALLVTGVLLHRRRVAPVTAALAVWLTVYAFGFNFFIHYVIWGLPFLLVLGRLREAAAVVAVLSAALALVYWDDEPEWLNWAGYTLPLIAFWAICVLALIRAARPVPAPSGTAT